MADFAKNMQNSESAPIRILRKDNNAHIVFDVATKIWGCILFKDGAVSILKNGRFLNDTLKLPLIEVSDPCLVMIEGGANEKKISVADPDLRLVSGGLHGTRKKDENTIQTLEIKLQGKWKLSGINPKEVTSKISNKDTIFYISTQDGASYSFKVENLNLRAIVSKVNKRVEEDKSNENLIDSPLLDFWLCYAKNKFIYGRDLIEFTNQKIAYNLNSLSCYQK